MSITVNGTVIPTTDGSIKVGDTNVQKVIVNDTTVWEVPQGYTISWSEALSQYGTFINSPIAEISTDSNFGGKQIVYTKPNGEDAVASPYQAGSITVKEGTDVYFEMFAGSGSDESLLLVMDNNRTTIVGEEGYAEGFLIRVVYRPTKNKTIERDYDYSDGSTYDWFISLMT